MGRELRMIKPGWEHPQDGFYSDGTIRYQPLIGRPFTESLAQWELGNAQWEAGLVEDWHPSKPSAWKLKEDIHANMTFAEWYGQKPVREEYMPEWAPSEATKFVMYEDTSEGTPISPAFDTPEELAHWLADTGASALGGMTASYESWLSTAKRGWSVSGVIINGEMRPGTDL